jgi:hypothetical protein
MKRYFGGKMSIRHIACINAVLIGSLIWTATASAAQCDTACLRAQLDRYVAALTERDPSSLMLISKLRYTENGSTLKVGEGLWKSASGLGTYQHRLVDAASQQAMFIGIVNEGSAPSIATVRLGIMDGEVNEIEHVVARKGSHALFAPQSFTKPHEALTSIIPTSKRLSRQRLIEIADSYFVGIEKHDSKVILSSETCQRVENGVQTTNQPGRSSRHCAQSADVLTYIESVDDRRYPIVDAEHGVVVATILFDIPGEKKTATSLQLSSDPQSDTRLRQPRTLLLTEWFKIEDGRIQHIEAIMHNLPHGSKSGWER